MELLLKWGSSLFGIGPKILQKLLDLVPNKKGTIGAVFIAVAYAFTRLYFLDHPVTGEDLEASWQIILGAIGAYYLARKMDRTEAKVEKVGAKVETVKQDVAEVQEGVEVAAEKAEEVAEALVEEQQKPKGIPMGKKF